MSFVRVCARGVCKYDLLLEIWMNQGIMISFWNTQQYHVSRNLWCSLANQWIFLSSTRRRPERPGRFVDFSLCNHWSTQANFRTSKSTPRITFLIHLDGGATCAVRVKQQRKKTTDKYSKRQVEHLTYGLRHQPKHFHKSHLHVCRNHQPCLSIAFSD